MELEKLNQLLEETFKNEEEKSISILTFSEPDPDYLASAYALQVMLTNQNISSKVYIAQKITYPNNIKLSNTLEMELSEDIPKTKYYAILDSQYTPTNDYFKNFYGEYIKSAKCLIHIDHHKATKTEAPFSNINTTIGACSTLMAEYIKELDLLNNSKESDRISLGLAYGIHSDIGVFYATKRDLEALAYLSPFYDSKELEAIATQKYSNQQMKVLSIALDNRVVQGNFSYAGVGYISKVHTICLSVASDLLLKQDGVTQSLVFALVEDDEGYYIEGKFRTDDTSIIVDDFCKKFVLKGKGGGRNPKGAFQEPLGILSTYSDKEQILKMVNDVMTQKIDEIISLNKSDTKEESNGK